MTWGLGIAVLLGIFQAASPDPEANIPGATGAPYAGEWAGMTSEIYNGDWAFVHNSPRVTTYLSRSSSPSGRNFDVTMAQVPSTSNGEDGAMIVLVINYQCDLNKVAIMKAQQFTAAGSQPPTLSMPRPQNWAGTGGFEVAANWLCKDGIPAETEYVRGLASIQRDALSRRSN